MIRMSNRFAKHNSETHSQEKLTRVEHEVFATSAKASFPQAVKLYFDKQGTGVDSCVMLRMSAEDARALGVALIKAATDVDNGFSPID